MKHRGKAYYQKLEKIGGNDACVMMHTALRKACDSTPTTVFYQLIHLICALRIRPASMDPWRLLGEMMAKSVNDLHAEGYRVINPYISLDRSVSELEDRWWERSRKRRQEKGRDADPENAREALYAITRSFRLFSEADKRGMAAYFRDEDEDEDGQA